MSNRKPFGSYAGMYRAGTQMVEFLDSAQARVVTSLLLFCFRNGLIEQALVTRMSEECPWKAEAVLARDEEAIVHARGSKYVFVKQRHLYGHLNDRTAVVGLPCQIARVANSPALKLGLFCGMAQSQRKIDYITQQFGIEKRDIATLTHRDTRNRMVIGLRNGQSISLPPARIGCFFALPMCSSCLDFSAHRADIAVGDFDFGGTNSVIIRTKRGSEVFERATSAGYIWAQEIETEDLVRHRTSPMVIKEYGSGYKGAFCRRCRGEWAFRVPLSVLSLAGGFCTIYRKYLVSSSILLRHRLRRLWRRVSN